MAVESIDHLDAVSVRRTPTLGMVVGFAVVVVGLRIGLRPLGDNSFLTHLATGRLILKTGGIPRVDPYSFTAAGEPWVVQSWLVSVWFGLLDAVGGLRAVQVATAAVTGLLAGLVWVLARPADGLLARLALVVTVLVIGVGGWSERPYLYGLVFLALVLLGAEGRLDPRWLVPVMWVWVNSHGSFPLALVALGTLAIGRRLDGERPTVELRALRWATIGVLSGAVNPLGPRLLVFPLELLARSEQLSTIIEWQAPRFQNWTQRAFLVLLMVAAAALARRPAWRLAIPLVVFAPLALLSARNVVVAAVVIVPVAAASLAGWGSVRCSTPRARGRVLVAGLALAAALVTGATFRSPAVALGAYPVESLAWMADQGLLTPGTRVVAPDYVGNYLTYTGAIPVFFDDRVDMYPAAVTQDMVRLVRLRPGWDEVLARWADVIVWRLDAPLGQVLVLPASGWRVVHTDDQWLVAVRSEPQ